MRAFELLMQGAALLCKSGPVDAMRDARRLLAHVLDVPMARLTLIMHDPVSTSTQEAYLALIKRRAAHEPVSHLTGTRQFYGRSFCVGPDVLDPRPETEILISAALERPFDHVLDLGTGSGCILLTLLAERQSARGIGTDLSEKALDVAFSNRAALGLEARARLTQGRWFEAVPKAARFDLIVSNPPYIALSEMAGLAPDVLNYEPHMALCDGADGRY